MQRKTIIIIGIVAVVLLAGVFMFLYGPGYRYSHMYGQGYGYGPMMGQGYDYRGMRGPGYGYGGMMGPGYGHGSMMEQGYGYGPMMGPGYGNRGYNELGLMGSELNLTEEQTKQLYGLADNYRLKYFESRGNIEELDKLEQQHRKDIESILTPGQKEIFDKYKRGFDRYGWFGGCPYH